MGRKRLVLKPHCRFSPMKKIIKVGPITKLSTVDADLSDSTSSVVSTTSVESYDSDPGEMCSKYVWTQFVTTVQQYKSKLEAILNSFPNTITVQENLIGIKKLEEYYNSYNQSGKAPLLTCYDLCLREFEKLVHDL